MFDNLQTALVHIGEYGLFGYDPWSIKQAIESGGGHRGVITAIGDGRSPYERNFGKYTYFYFYRLEKEDLENKIREDKLKASRRRRGGNIRFC